MDRMILSSTQVRKKCEVLRKLQHDVLLFFDLVCVIAVLFSNLVIPGIEQ